MRLQETKREKGHWRYAGDTEVASSHREPHTTGRDRRELKVSDYRGGIGGRQEQQRWIRNTSRVAYCAIWFLKLPHSEAKEKVIVNVNILGGSSSVLELLETIGNSAPALAVAVISFPMLVLQQHIYIIYIIFNILIAKYFNEWKMQWIMKCKNIKQ